MYNLDGWKSKTFTRRHFPFPWNHKEEESKISLTELNRDFVTDWLTLWKTQPWHLWKTCQDKQYRELTNAMRWHSLSVDAFNNQSDNNQVWSQRQSAQQVSNKWHIPMIGHESKKDIDTDWCHNTETWCQCKPRSVSFCCAPYRQHLATVQCLSRKLKNYPFELIGVVLAPAVMAMTVAFWALNTVFFVQAQEASLRFTVQLRQNLESFLGDL